MIQYLPGVTCDTPWGSVGCRPRVHAQRCGNAGTPGRPGCPGVPGDSVVDTRSFDHLTRSLVTRGSRRGVLTRLAVMPLGAGVLALAVFLLASQLVSYVKARAEALGAECRIGLMQRPERLIGLVFLSWVAAWPGPGVKILIVGLSLMALLTAFTVYQRFVHVLKSLDQAGGR